MDTLIERLIQHFGNVSATARAFNKTRQEIYIWRDKGIPFKRGVQVEELTNGAIKAVEVWEAAAKARHHSNGIAK